MTKVVLSAPPGVSGMSVRGIELEVVDGVVTVESDLVSELTPHGFTRKDGVPTVSSSRSELVNSLVSQIRTVVEGLQDSQLRDFSALDDSAKNEFWESFRKSVSGYPEYVSAQSVEKTGALLSPAPEAPKVAVTPPKAAPTPAPAPAAEVKKA